MIKDRVMLTSALREMVKESQNCFAILLILFDPKSIVGSKNLQNDGKIVGKSH